MNPNKFTLYCIRQCAEIDGTVLTVTSSTDLENADAVMWTLSGIDDSGREEVIADRDSFKAVAELYERITGQTAPEPPRNYPRLPPLQVGVVVEVREGVVWAAFATEAETSLIEVNYGDYLRRGSPYIEDLGLPADYRDVFYAIY